MKTKWLTIISVVTVSGAALIFSCTAMGQQASRGGKYQQSSGASQTNAMPSPGSKGAGGNPVATPITPQEAAKKYPAPNGRYPIAERDPHDPSGVVRSPYPPREKFDCSNIAHGGLAIDTRVNKVFVRP